MPRPQADTECLNYIRSSMEKAEKVLDGSKDNFVLVMLQENKEVTDCITAACFAYATAFASKFNIEPTKDNIHKLITDAVFMNGIAPVIKALIKADEEAT